MHLIGYLFLLSGFCAWLIGYGQVTSLRHKRLGNPKYFSIASLFPKNLNSSERWILTAAFLVACMLVNIGAAMLKDNQYAPCCGVTEQSGTGEATTNSQAGN